MSVLNNADVLLAVTRGRCAVDSYVSESLSQGRIWNEESATERLIMAAHPEVRYVEFNRPQEDIIGADWLWWFVDQSGECLGALIQAKKLKVQTSTFAVDFKHPGGDEAGKQLRDLLAASDIFKVPAAYAIYCGNYQYRGGHKMCPIQDQGEPCRRCERAGVLLLPGLGAQELLERTPAEAGASAFAQGVPLEDVVDENVPTANVEDYFRYLLGDEFADLMEKPQTGARDIAKIMFKAVKDIRNAPLVKFDKPMAKLGPEAVFRDVFAGGASQGSPLLPYEHILRGLRHQLPAYVEPAMAGGEFPSEYLPYLAGMVLVPLTTQPE